MKRVTLLLDPETKRGQHCFEAWAKKANAGDGCLYFKGLSNKAGGIKALARKMYEDGKIHLVQRRPKDAGKGCFEYWAVKASPKK